MVELRHPPLQLEVTQKIKHVLYKDYKYLFCMIQTWIVFGLVYKALKGIHLYPPLQIYIMVVGLMNFMNDWSRYFLENDQKLP